MHLSLSSDITVDIFSTCTMFSDKSYCLIERIHLVNFWTTTNMLKLNISLFVPHSLFLISYQELQTPNRSNSTFLISYQELQARTRDWDLRKLAQVAATLKQRKPGQNIPLFEKKQLFHLIKKLPYWFKNLRDKPLEASTNPSSSVDKIQQEEERYSSYIFWIFPTASFPTLTFLNYQLAFFFFPFFGWGLSISS